MRQITLIDNLIYKLNKSNSFNRTNRLKNKIKKKLKKYFTNSIYFSFIEEPSDENEDLFFEFINLQGVNSSDKYLKIYILDKYVKFEIEFDYRINYYYDDYNSDIEYTTYCFKELLDYIKNIIYLHNLE